MTQQAATPLWQSCRVVNPDQLSDLHTLAQQLDLEELTGRALPTGGLALMASPRGLALQDLGRDKMQPLVVDFVSGKTNHRRLFGGGKGQLIAKAVGLGGKFKPRVLDATAGLGGDAFVLACLGCEVTLLERNPVVRALLADGLARARMQAEPDLLAVIERMQLCAGDAIDYLGGSDLAEDSAQVVYLDPMFPERKKTAAVKKEMQLFHQLVGADPDQQQLLSQALQACTYRVVVKRPRLAQCISGVEPSYQLLGKTSRYDIYTKQKMPA